ncbi:MAG TPA: class I SAM-dependent methyltransferase [Thermoanaerobaculia bacterium]
MIEARRRVLRWGERRRIIAALPPGARQLYLASTTNYTISLSPEDERVRAEVLAATQRINGSDWNFYSDALRPEIIEGFVRAVEALPARSVRYLEIGSNRGLSMASIVMFLRDRGRFGSATSIDPYFDDGYREGASSPYGTEKTVPINKATRDQALALYRYLGVEVELIEMTSTDGLRRLIAAGKEFDLIYIDGLHEGLVPASDFGMSLACLARDGVVILDDHMWPDVMPLKALCDRHAEAVAITWKTAAYRVPG